MRIYGYSRISRDEDKANYDTIITQNKMIERYSISEFDCPVIDIFEDDNVSGYTFDREGLNKLKKLIENKKVDVLLLKDLSRLGRHNAKTLLFLEYLEKYDVRIVLIHDNYDSEEDDDDIIGIKSWYNERYLKDISRKIKSSLETKQKDTGLITKVPFGYHRSKTHKHKLVLDEEAAIVVKRIFRLYIEGHGGRRIANIFNDEGVLTPSKYAYIKTGKKISGSIAELWTGTHVMRILKNDVYIGNLRSRKTQRKKINGKTVLLNEKQHIVHENQHQPIISIDDFELVQNIIKSRKSNNVRGTSNKINLFIGFLKCGDCGGGFMKVNKKRSEPGYICSNYHHFGADFCTTHRISEEQLKEIILDKLKLMKYYIEDSLEDLDKDIRALVHTNIDYERSIKKNNIKIVDKKEEIKNYSRQLAQGIINEDIALEMIQEANKELKKLEFTASELANSHEMKARLKVEAINSLDIINELIQSGDITRKDLEKLVKMITIKQLSKPTPNAKPILNIDIEWDVFISSTYSLIDYYNTDTKYSLP